MRERGGDGVDGIGDGKNVLEYWWVLVDSAVQVHCMAIRPMLTMANRLFSYYAIRNTTRWDVSCSTLNCGHAISVIPFHTQYSIGHATLRAKRTMAQSMCVRRHLWYIWQELNPTEERRENDRKSTFVKYNHLAIDRWTLDVNVIYLHPKCDEEYTSDG